MLFRHRVGMPNKDRPLVDRHAPKKGVGWLVNDQEGKFCSFTKANPTEHAQWVVIETRPLRGSGQSVVLRMHRQTQRDAGSLALATAAPKRHPPSPATFVNLSRLNARKFQPLSCYHATSNGCSTLSRQSTVPTGPLALP